MKISKEAARNFLLNRHFLNGCKAAEPQNIIDYIKTAGCIQYDPLNTVARNADLVLQSRFVGYNPDVLYSLLYNERKLLDGWDKVMSIYHIDDWPYFQRVRKVRAEGAVATLKYRGQEQALLHKDAVLEFLAANGPSAAKDIKLGQVATETWGHKSVAGAVLDYLFHAGKIGVYGKKGAVKIYDLVENLLPAEVLNAPDPFANEADFMDWYVLRRLGCMGLLWAKPGGAWLGDFIYVSAKRKAAIERLFAAGKIVEVEVEGIRDKFFTKAEDADEITKASKPDEIMRFIAPLDNIIWDRAMISALFDFDYTWEVYVPAAKRKYGYYVLPVLHNGRFVGRIEPVRQGDEVVIKNIWWEKEADVQPAVQHSLTTAVEMLHDSIIVRQ